MTKTPNFVCLGAQKAGTTTMHDILKQHPDIYLPENKEAPFFNNDKAYKKGLEWWMNEYFSDYDGKKLLGVMTPEYLYYDEIPDRIFRDFGPDIKLIIILRQPVDRAYSNYLMSKRRGYELLPFNEAVEQETERIKKGELERTYLSYILRGKYVEQIKRYLNLFEKDQILFLCFETDIRNNLKDTMLKVQSFIGVKPLDLETNIKSNAATELRSSYFQQLFHKEFFIKSVFKFLLPSGLRTWIRIKLNGLNRKKLSPHNRLTKEEKKQYYSRFFEAEKEELESITGLDLNHWIIE